MAKNRECYKCKMDDSILQIHNLSFIATYLI